MRQKTRLRRVAHALVQTRFGRFILVESGSVVVGALIGWYGSAGLGVADRWTNAGAVSCLLLFLGFFGWLAVDWMRSKPIPIERALTKQQTKQEFKGVFGCFGFLLLVGMCLVAAWNWTDSEGWIPHQKDTTITARADWFDGEIKDCISYVPQAGTVGSKDGGSAVAELYCDSGPEREVSVTFWGRLSQPEYDVVNWKCKRDSGGFTCYELSGERLSPRH